MTDKDELEALLSTMCEQGLPVQKGGFDVDVIPTGIASFDLSTGVGGIPRRRISLFLGKEGSGKTLMILSLFASIQKSGGRAAFIDAEHALTPDFARLLGVEYEDLVISRPRTLEQCYDVARKFTASGLFDAVGFDSVVALATEADLELTAAQSTKRAGQAQVHSAELKKITAICDPRTAFVLTNQLRVDPNPPSWWRGGPREYAPGGGAISFYASLRVMMRTTEVFKSSNGLRVGHRIKTTITKNKVAAPFQVAEFDIQYEAGLDTIMYMINIAISTGIITKRSSWYYYDEIDMEDGEVVEEHKWLGRDKMDGVIREDDDLRSQILQRLSQENEDPTTAWDSIE